MRPPRLKLRTLIVLVALATLAVGGVEYRRRAARYRAMAADAAQFEEQCRATAVSYQRLAETFRMRIDDNQSTKKESAGNEELSKLLSEFVLTDEQIRRMEEQSKSSLAGAKTYLDRAAAYARRRAAFLRCARYPWLSPPPDDSEPE